METYARIYYRTVCETTIVLEVTMRDGNAKFFLTKNKIPILDQCFRSDYEGWKL